ncbi:MAG: RdgB/HAM1 family non-canonical purine NTP pyrophosphatase [Ruminococcus sp.]|nr:RdgB/HAM1 family non-canonical purine NTP pyrophosphatase [Ruminococcus sp.]
MIFATNNKGKLEEIKKILCEYKIYSLKEKGIDIDVIEDKDTFLGNALKKAKEIYDITHEDVIADDSGLCIDALNGFPGVLTHRFLGEDATDRMRNLSLIERTNQKKDRKAQVKCVLVYYNGKDAIIGEGIIDGFIAKECRGINGFGFDEIFELPNGLTLAELNSDEKNRISARALAAQNLKRELTKYNI